MEHLVTNFSQYAYDSLDAFIAEMARDTDGKREEKYLLSLTKKYCTETVVFDGLSPDENLRLFYTRTMKMLDEECLSDCPSTENAFTVLSNMLLLLNNTAVADRKTHGHLSLINWSTDAALAIKCIEKHHRVTQTYARNMYVHKVLIWLRQKLHMPVVLVTVSVCSAVIGIISGAISQKHAEKINVPVTGIFNAIGEWWTYDLLQNARPDDPEAIYAQNWACVREVAFIVTIAVAVLLCMLMVAIWVSEKRYEQSIKQEDEFGDLRQALFITANQLREVETENGKC